MAKTNDTLTIDIHGLYADEAKEKLEKEIARAPAYVKIIKVIFYKKPFANGYDPKE